MDSAPSGQEEAAVEARQNMGVILMQIIQAYDISQEDRAKALAAIHQYTQTHDDRAAKALRIKLDVQEAHEEYLLDGS
ncbi:MAG: hypothetical protein KKB70_02620 [Proteobacteria bacterium]|nr:hypothetical protein [Pseudomonadota bacterium]